MGNDDAGTVARDYFDAWTSRQGPETVGKYLHEDFVFTAGPMRIEGRDAFMAGASWPEQATTVMVADAYSDGHGLQLYQATNGAHTVKIVEHLVISDGKIASSDVVADSAAFGAFMTG